MKYKNRLDNYDVLDIVHVGISSELYEETFAIFKKFEVKYSIIAVSESDVFSRWTRAQYKSL